MLLNEVFHVTELHAVPLQILHEPGDLLNIGACTTDQALQVILFILKPIIEELLIQADRGELWYVGLQVYRILIGLLVVED